MLPEQGVPPCEADVLLWITTLHTAQQTCRRLHQVLRVLPRVAMPSVAAHTPACHFFKCVLRAALPTSPDYSPAVSVYTPHHPEAKASVIKPCLEATMRSVVVSAPSPVRWRRRVPGMNQTNQRMHINISRLCPQVQLPPGSFRRSLLPHHSSSSSQTCLPPARYASALRKDV